MARKDFDGDCEIETSEQEYKGSKDKAIKKAAGETKENLKESFSKYVNNILRKILTAQI